MSNEELIKSLDRLRNMMVSVSTGGPRIEEVNNEYKELYQATDEGLRERGIKNPNVYPDLWDWYGQWRSGDLPSYQSRRSFLSEIFTPLVKQVRELASGTRSVTEEPTGWARIDRTAAEIRLRLASADSTEKFQAVGLLCREALISLAEAVYERSRHPPIDGIEPSTTDAKRMLESYLAIELGGATHEVARKHARASIDLAIELQHRRTAEFRQAALCVEATTSVINVIAIISGRRDPR
jgi:hypothetical protein